MGTEVGKLGGLTSVPVCHAPHTAHHSGRLQVQVAHAIGDVAAEHCGGGGKGLGDAVTVAECEECGEGGVMFFEGGWAKGGGRQLLGPLQEARPRANCGGIERPQVLEGAQLAQEVLGSPRRSTARAAMTNDRPTAAATVERPLVSGPACEARAYPEVPWPGLGQLCGGTRAPQQASE